MTTWLCSTVLPDGVVPQSWMFNDPCDTCGVKRLDHDPSQIRHRYRSPALPPASTYDCEFWDIVNNTTAGTVERAVHRHGEREGNGAYEVPLPDPESGRLIRERAGLTQQIVAVARLGREKPRLAYPPHVPLQRFMLSSIKAKPPHPE